MTKEIGNRPWGHYIVLLDSEQCKVKKITVNPNQRLSYQSHEKRREQWTVVEGELTVVLDGEEHTVYAGSSIHIPLGSKHRAWNQTGEELSFIEVQTGDYFGEDDIIRLEDSYGRA
mgnify:FL=1